MFLGGLVDDVRTYYAQEDTRDMMLSNYLLQ